jgi:hypothetical protein
MSMIGEYLKWADLKNCFFNSRSSIENNIREGQIYDSDVYSTSDLNKVRKSDMPDFVASYLSSLAFTMLTALYDSVIS